jgi:two-component system chemotaxis response regulator CheB
MDGFEATRRIMTECPTPIVVVSASVESSGLAIPFNAIKAGALEVIEKPPGFDHANFETIREQLVTTVKLMAEVKVIRRHGARAAVAPPRVPRVLPRHQRPCALIAIGASTGGPAALNVLFKSLPREFPVPVVVVQHISSGFAEALVHWLQSESQLPMRMVKGEQHIRPGEVYFAPDDQHLVFVSRGVLGLSREPTVSHVRPSATVLFKSAARFYGAEVAGVLLTGMGDDGAAGLKAIRDKGGLTVVQDEATSVVYGMSKAAVELGAVEHILPLEQIADTLLGLVRG